MERVLEAAEQRSRIASDLHDNFAQALTGANLRLGICVELLKAGRAGDAEREAERLREELRGQYAELRELVRSLAGNGVSSTLTGASSRARVALDLHFEPPDRETFPCLELGFEVMRRGGTAGAALNAANEAAVQRFLDGQIAFLDIPRACRAALDHHEFDPRPSLATLGRVDAWARQEVARWQP